MNESNVDTFIQKVYISTEVDVIYLSHQYQQMDEHKIYIVQNNH